MRCNHCHEDVELQWKFCPHCGRTLVDEKIIYWFWKALHTKKIAYAILVFEIVFIGFVAYLMVDSSKQLQQKNKRVDELINSRQELTVDWKVKEKIFPINYVGDNQRLVELKVSSESYVKIKVEVVAEGITTTMTKLVDIKPGGNLFHLGPDITEAGYQRLSESKKVPVQLKVTVMDDPPREIVSGQKETFFHSTNDIVWDDKGTNNSKFIVRLANKDKLEVKNVVRKAADHMKEVGGQENAMIGEQGDADEIRRQLQAIFLAIAKDYQVRYVMAPYSYDSSDVQKIKSPQEVLATQSGLCVELSLLIAAALENIGLNPVIVVTDDHAWPGVEIDASQNEYVFIESTMLDYSAEQAWQQGMLNWQEVYGQPGEYRLLKVTQLRSEGLLPMKY